MADNTVTKRRGASVEAKGDANGQELEEELPTLTDPATLTRKGLCPVTHIRGQDDDPFESHSLYFEIHGSGPERVVLIMGYASPPYTPRCPASSLTENIVKILILWFLEIG